MFINHLVPQRDLNCTKIKVGSSIASIRGKRGNLLQTKMLIYKQTYNGSAFKINLIFIFVFGARIKASKPKQTTKCIPTKYFILYSVFMTICKKQTTL